MLGQAAWRYLGRTPRAVARLCEDAWPWRLLAFWASVALNAVYDLYHKREISRMSLEVLSGFPDSAAAG